MREREKEGREERAGREGEREEGRQEEEEKQISMQGVGRAGWKGVGIENRGTL